MLELFEAILFLLLLIFAMINAANLSKDKSLEENVYHGIWAIILFLILS